MPPDPDTLTEAELTALEGLFPRWGLTMPKRPCDNYDAAYTLLMAAPSLVAEIRRLRTLTPLLERLQAASLPVDSDYRPTCESAPYGPGCYGARDEDVAFWQAAFAIVEACRLSAPPPALPGSTGTGEG